MADVKGSTDVESQGLVWNGSSWDKAVSLDALDAAPNVRTGILAAGIGPGFDIKFNPANLGSVVGNAITNTVDGADTVIFAIGTTTTGTFIFEVTADDVNWITAPMVYYQNDSTRVAVTQVPLLSAWVLKPTAHPSRDPFAARYADWLKRSLIRRRWVISRRTARSAASPIFPSSPS